MAKFIGRQKRPSPRDIKKIVNVRKPFSALEKNFKWSPWHKSCTRSTREQAFSKYLVNRNRIPIEIDYNRLGCRSWLTYFPFGLHNLHVRRTFQRRSRCSFPCSRRFDNHHLSVNKATLNGPLTTPRNPLPSRGFPRFRAADQKGRSTPIFVP